jgi:hypothetical protein
VGVIFGRDLVYDAGWRGNRKISHDSVVKKAPEEEFVNLVKQTYRVLLTRGMKGCYVYFEDAATKDFFVSRVNADAARAQSGTVAQVLSLHSRECGQGSADGVTVHPDLPSFPPPHKSRPTPIPQMNTFA